MTTPEQPLTFEGAVWLLVIVGLIVAGVFYAKHLQDQKEQQQRNDRYFYTCVDTATTPDQLQACIG